MFKASEFTKNFYKPSEVASLFQVSAQTIRNRVDNGEMGCSITEGGHRLISREHLLKYLRERGLLYEVLETSKHDVIYARVSSHEQKTKGDLDRQVVHILENTSGLCNVLVLKEVGMGFMINADSY